MPIFINLKDKNRINLFTLVKKNMESPWEKIYPKFNISRPMFFNYKSGKYDIPKQIFLKLEKIAKIKYNHKEVHKNKFIERKIIKPKTDHFLAEILGILNGDGHISKINNEICVVSSILEKDYVLYIKKLFEKQFNLKFKMQKQHNKLKLRTYSKKLAELLNKKYKTPRGKKTGKLRIPKQIFNSKKMLTFYIKGLFDTDGTIYIRRKKDVVLEIASVDKKFLNDIKKALKILRFNAGTSGKNLYLYKKEEITNFFKIIKPANSKHLKKYKIYSTL